MNELGPRKSSGWLIAGALSLSLGGLAFAMHPDSAAAAGSVRRVISFQSNGFVSQHATVAGTVGAFLQERGIAVGPRDYVRPALETALTEGTIVEYDPAIAVRVVDGRKAKTVVTTSGDVGAVLEEQGITLRKDDEVSPALSRRLAPGDTIRIVRVSKWTRTLKRAIAMRTIHRLNFSMAAERSKVVAKGDSGERETVVRYIQRNGKLQKHIIASHIVRKARDRVIEQGVGQWLAFAQLARRGLEKTSFIAANALDMVATAYTGACGGCSGWTASGRRAGRGIVAVDPRVIPLGTKLFIPGYGVAIAGDTGGAIRGRRIDLGFNSLLGAQNFGRRIVKVYTLK